jgi:hypothetical protein
MSGSVQGASLKECVRTRGREVGSRVSPEHEVALIKVSSLRNHHLLGHRVVELPALAALRVPNEDTLLHVCPKAPKWSLIPLDQHIGSAAPNSKHREVWLAPIDRLVWSHVRECRGE